MNPIKILIVKIGAAGDVLRTTSLVVGLKEKYPKSIIHWLAESAVAPILENNPNIDSVFYVDKNTRNLFPRFYDLIINLDEDRDVCELIMNVATKKIIGTYFDGEKISYTKESREKFDMSKISKLSPSRADRLKRANRKTYQEMIHDMVGIKYSDQRPHMPISKSDIKYAANFASKNRMGKYEKIIAINTGSGPKWPGKRMSTSDTVELIRVINNKYPSYGTLLLGGPNETVRNIDILNKSPKVIDSGTSNSIGQYAAIVNLCDTLITSDTFTLHIGTALDKRIVAFFAPTSPHEIDLYGNGAKITPVNNACLCCYRPNCKTPPKYDINKIVNLI